MTTTMTSNKVSIETVFNEIKATAPEGVSVAWQFPGYISVLLPSGTEICFGEDQEADSGYSWNDFDAEGSNRMCGQFPDLGNAEAIAKEFWFQAKEVA